MRYVFDGSEIEPKPVNVGSFSHLLDFGSISWHAK